MGKRLTLAAGPGAIGQLARAAEIATILSASGLGWLVQALGLGTCASARGWLGSARWHREKSPSLVSGDVPMPERLRVTVERLGPAFVKAGQMLALRPDYIPLDYAMALRSLHTMAEPFTAAEAVDIIEAEFGAPLGSLFTEFEEQPFAAASLSQVHRAELQGGRCVAVKVQRPGIRTQVEQDLALLATLARRLERRQHASLAFRPSEAAAELADYTRRELDFRREARTAERLREMFRDHDRIVIPAVHSDRTSARVLTTDYLDGQHPAAASDLARAGYDVTAGLRAGAEAMLRQVFQFGLFHADPHPGNILFLPGDRVGFLDFGMFGRLDSTQRRRMAVICWALIEGDHDAVGSQLLRLCEFLPGADPAGFRSAFADMIDDGFGRPAGEFSVPRLLLHGLALGARHRVAFPRELMLVGRALVTLEATAATIDPQFNLADLVRPLLPELRDILLPTPHALHEHLHRHRFDYLNLAIEIPALLHQSIARQPHGPASSPAQPPASRRWLRLGAAFVAGAGLASLVRGRGREFQACITGARSGG